MRTKTKYSSVDIRDTEIWKPFPKNPKYEISDEGHIRRKTKSGYVYSVGKVGRENNRVRAYFGPNLKSYPLKNAVWETFKGEIPKGYMLISKNGANTICELYNLQLVNRRKYYQTMLKKRSKTMRKFTKPVKDLNTGIVYSSIAEASKALFVSNSAITYICNKATKNPITNINVEWYEGENYE